MPNRTVYKNGEWTACAPNCGIVSRSVTRAKHADVSPQFEIGGTRQQPLLAAHSQSGPYLSIGPGHGSYEAVNTKQRTRSNEVSTYLIARSVQRTTQVLGYCVTTAKGGKRNSDDEKSIFHADRPGLGSETWTRCFGFDDCSLSGPVLTRSAHVVGVGPPCPVLAACGWLNIGTGMTRTVSQPIWGT
jgi:hypothetical protein